MTMEMHQDLDDLITKKLTDNLTKKEQVVFEKWLGESPDHRTEFDYLSKIWNEKSREPKMINSGLKAKNIWSLAKNGPNNSFNISRHPPYNQYLKIAAMITIVLGAAIMFYRTWKPVEEDMVALHVDETVRSSSPSGSKTRVVLPDGSVAWLNSDSYVEFPKNFSNEARNIDLVGEAYFEVKKDSLRPFTVRSLGASTTALGTSFNISAFPENEIVEVHLITGRVLVNNVELTPGEGAFYNKTKEYIKVSAIDPNQVLGWKNGVLIFDGDDFPTFIKKIERWYGLEIIINGKPKAKWSVKGRFEKEYLTNVLNTVGFNKSFAYVLEGKKLEINF